MRLHELVDKVFNTLSEGLDVLSPEETGDEIGGFDSGWIFEHQLDKVASADMPNLGGSSTDFEQHQRKERA